MPIVTMARIILVECSFLRFYSTTLHLIIDKRHAFRAVRRAIQVSSWGANQVPNVNLYRIDGECFNVMLREVLYRGMLYAIPLILLVSVLFGDWLSII